VTDADDGGWGDDDGGWGDDGEDGGRRRRRRERWPKPPSTGEPTSSEPFFDATRRDGVLELARERAEWLSTGWRGGRTRADAVYNCTVPGNWRCDDVAGFVRERLDEAGFAESGVGVEDAPVLLTGVAMEHARGARVGPVEAYATAGVSNPAALPTEPAGGDLPDGEYVAGTVNVVVGTTRAPAPGAFANLVAIAAEARAATLLSRWRAGDDERRGRRRERPRWRPGDVLGECDPRRCGDASVRPRGGRRRTRRPLRHGRR